jgi:ABC-2 type transport system ATP-binding protein
LIKAEKIMDDKNITIDQVECSISINILNGVKEVKLILNKLEDSGIEIEGMSLHKPTLDDVFLNLTGHEAIKDNSTNKENNV